MNKTLFVILATILFSPAHATEVYFEKSRDLPLVYVNVVFRGGGTQDPEGKSGSTDIMTRLLLRGTKNKTKQHNFLIFRWRENLKRIDLWESNKKKRISKR